MATYGFIYILQLLIDAGKKSLSECQMCHPLQLVSAATLLPSIKPGPRILSEVLNQSKKKITIDDKNAWQRYVEGEGSMAVGDTIYTTDCPV